MLHLGPLYWEVILMAPRGYCSSSKFDRLTLSISSHWSVNNNKGWLKDDVAVHLHPRDCTPLIQLRTQQSEVIHQKEEPCFETCWCFTWTLTVFCGFGIFFSFMLICRSYKDLFLSKQVFSGPFRKLYMGHSTKLVLLVSLPNICMCKNRLLMNIWSQKNIWYNEYLMSVFISIFFHNISTKIQKKKRKKHFMWFNMAFPTHMYFFLLAVLAMTLFIWNKNQNESCNFLFSLYIVL